MREVRIWMAKNIVIGQKMRSQTLEVAKYMRTIQTPQEKKLWECLRANRLDGRHFRRQQVIDHFIVDFYCHSAGLVIELDGSVHDDPDQYAYDQERDQAIVQRGLRILRIWDSEIENNLDVVLKRIRAACELSPLPDMSDGLKDGF
jgi:very-short-patch-repair endonuclease